MVHDEIIDREIESFMDEYPSITRAAEQDGNEEMSFFVFKVHSEYRSNVKHRVYDREDIERLINERIADGEN